ncbi:NAD(P)H-hydrate epimerase [Luteimicrobium subarcticum]|uniref:Bifunctional NAD(P)H-hydrate repair enzyme n=1 Tax=Luteimicrobium subarcticum TaxID=620910 RepID=A0A2M8WVC7_9MICO|nr:NAD(P)H-hydrate epimerase [Luteimicrobium subarcticum]PJI94878.1 hydroxyethylthiazole kinase-like uncharacterized protein yjeF [Luteimicrobium subarcticum]
MTESFAAADVRAAEEPLLAEGRPLMERAAFALALRVVSLVRARRGSLGGARVLLLVGSGSNGGDALFAGAALRRRGVAVDALALAARVHEPGRTAFERAGGRLDGATGADLRDGTAPTDATDGAARAAEHAVTYDVVVDALVGTGARGGLREPAAGFVARLDDLLHARSARERPVVVAVDVPSGVGVDDGTLPGPSLAADVTVTFGVAKHCLLLPPAASRAGEVHVADIGLGRVRGHGRAVRRLDGEDVAASWPSPTASDQKYSRGVLGIVAGSTRFPGAAVLASSGAVRAGVGMVRYVGPEPVAREVLAARPEVVPAEGRVQAWAVGPGLPGAGDDDLPDDVVEQHRHVRAVLAAAAGRLGADVGGRRVPVVVDAGALTLLPERVPPTVVLTPHAGELAALLRARGEDVDRTAVEAEPLRHAARAHELTGATVLLKGAVTIVVGRGVVWSQADGPAWLATAGAGDVLTGVLGALLAARSAEALADDTLPARLAAVAASVHGRAAHAANPGGPVAALDVAHAVPGVVAGLLRG